MRRLSRPMKIGLGVVAAIVGLNLLGYVLDAVGGARPGPPSSSYTTAPEGLAAYAELLARYGHPIQRVRAPLDRAPPPPEATVVVLGGEISDREAVSLNRFVTAGGRLIAGGGTAAWLRHVLDDPPLWSPRGGRSATTLAPVGENSGVETVTASGTGSYSDANQTLPILGDGALTTASVATAGRGRVVLLADAGLLDNERLDDSDNATFGVNIAGEPGRPVLFVETVHGYQQSGVDAIPSRWRWASLTLGLAAIVFMLARGRRLGQADQVSRALDPPRRDFVESVARTLARTRDHGTAAKIIQNAIRHRIETYGAGGTDEAATAAGLSEAQRRALISDAPDEEDLVTLSRTLAELEDRTATTPGRKEN